jgi:hypothetical protein
MTIRKRDDSVKLGRGIDGTEGENYSREYAVNPWKSNPKKNYLSPQGRGAYQLPAADFLNNRLPDEATSEPREILSEVEANQPENRAIKSRGQR